MKINALRTRISDLKKEYNRKLGELQQGSVIVSNKEMTGVETVLSAPYDFHVEVANINCLASDIAYLTAALAKANSTTQIGVGNHTIQSAIATLAEIRPLFNKIDYIVSNTRERIVRKDAYGSNGSSYFEVAKLNFDKVNLLTLKNNLQREINELETAIEVANSTTEVEL